MSELASSVCCACLRPAKSSSSFWFLSSMNASSNHSRFFEPDAGEYFLLLRLPDRKSGSPRFGLPQERDATLSKSTSVRSDGHLVRRRYVAEADREHALCEWDDWSHHALPLESGGGVDDVQSARKRDVR